MSPINRFLNSVLANLKQGHIRSYLEDLVKIPSVYTKEDKIARHISSLLRKIGFNQVNRIPIPDVGPSVLASIKKDSEGPTFLLAGHMDTVPVYDGWRSKPFRLMEKSGRLYGLGSLDMKGGLACLLTAAEHILQYKEKLKGNLMFAAFSDEEGWSRGVNRLIDKKYLAKVDFALFGEPSNANTITVARRGRIILNIEIHSPSKHAADPRGVNAVKEAALLIKGLEKASLGYNREFNVKGSVTPLAIQSRATGLSHPERCLITLDRHYLPGDAIRRVINDIRRLINKSGLKSKVKIKLGVRPTPHPQPYITSKQHPLVMTLTSAVKKITGKKPTYRMGRSVADENFLSVRGRIPTVSYGPGGGNAHSPNEFVNLADLLPVTKVYVHTMVKLMA